LTRYLLDTNIVSDAIKPAPSASLLAWMRGQEDRDLFISTLSVAEIRRGILDLPQGRKRAALDDWFHGSFGPRALFSGRILPFDENSAIVWARIMSEGKARGRPRNAFDMMIAAIAEANGCVVVSGNARDFEGIAIVNPFRGAVK
jgi:predicted nucleic acid-binding protein